MDLVPHKFQDISLK